MSYVKKVLIFNQADASFAVSGKSIAGVLKLENTVKGAEASLFISNFNVRILGEVKCVLKVGGEAYCHSVTQLNEFTVRLRSLHQNDAVECVVAIFQGKTFVPFAYASSGKNKAAALELAALLNGGYAIRDAEDEPATEYEEFVASSSNYFEDAGLEFENPAEGKDVFRRLWQKKGGEYVREMDSALEVFFAKYEAFDILMSAVKNSYWAKVPCRDESYFAVGIVSDEDKAVCLCYAVPTKGSHKPSDKDFFEVKADGGTFWVLCQDASSGRCAPEKFRYLFAKSQK